MQEEMLARDQKTRIRPADRYQAEPQTWTSSRAQKWRGTTRKSKKISSSSTSTGTDSEMERTLTGSAPFGWQWLNTMSSGLLPPATTSLAAFRRNFHNKGAIRPQSDALLLLEEAMLSLHKTTDAQGKRGRITYSIRPHVRACARNFSLSQSSLSVRATASPRLHKISTPDPNGLERNSNF